jgi:hypothetical protein
MYSVALFYVCEVFRGEQKKEENIRAPPFRFRSIAKNKPDISHPLQGICEGEKFWTLASQKTGFPLLGFALGGGFL